MPYSLVVASKYMAFGRPEVAFAAMSWHELMFVPTVVPTPAFAITPFCVPPCGTERMGDGTPTTQ